MVNINQYRSRITIQKASLVSNNSGGYVKTYSSRCTVWAEITPLDGYEGMRYKQLYPTARYKVMIRYRSDIDTDCRVLYYTTVYNILSITDKENRHEELTLLLEVRPDEN